MSRHSVVANVKIEDALIVGAPVAYGSDHMCGYFIQVFNPLDHDILLVDEDSMFTGLTGGKMVDTFENMGISHKIPKRHREAAASDLPIED